MAKKPAEAAAPPAQEPAAAAPEAAVEPAAQVEEAAASDEPAEAAAPPAAAGDEDAEISADESQVDASIDNNAILLMSHPDNGNCDAYETDKAGRLLVPALEVPQMLSHGFIVVAADEA